MRIPTIGVLAIAVPLVLSACATDGHGEQGRRTVEITVCDQRPADRAGAVDIITTASGDEYLMVTSPDGSGMWEGLVYEIDVESSENIDDLIVGHKQLNEKAEPCP